VRLSWYCFRLMEPDGVPGSWDTARRHESRRRATAHIAGHLSFKTLADLE